MSKVVRRKKSTQKNKFRTALIVLIIAVCLFVIYRFNFTTKSEIEITTPVIFKEFESENEILANIPVLEDSNGKYIILPEKVNGIYTSVYYLSDKEIEKVEENTNTIVDNTISAENNVNEEIKNKVTENKVSKNEVLQNNITEENNLNNTVLNETKSNQTATNEIQENRIEKVTYNQESESLFSAATQTSEEYADMLEEIAGVDDTNLENDSTNEDSDSKSTISENLENEENTNDENQNSDLPEQEKGQVENENQTTEVDQTQSDNSQENSTVSDNFSEIGNEIITEKIETLPGEKYYLSEEEFENEKFALTVKFQTVEIKGEKLYKQELTSDMIDSIVTLTCYTPLGYYLDVKEEDTKQIDELKSDVEEIAKSSTVLAYDIKITDGKNEFQPEEYYQVATVSITKPETVDFKSNSHSLQLLHIKETDDTIDFQKMPMSNVESDSFEFSTDEFSIYAVILYAADQGTSVTINDYESDKNYYLGKNYTDYMAGYDTGRYTEDNLAQVNINYYSYDPDINLNQTETITLSNCNWSFNNNAEHDTETTGPAWNPVTTITSSKYTVTTTIENPVGSYIDIDDTWSMEFTVPTTLRTIFVDSFNLNQTNSINNGLNFSYDSNTYKLTITAQNMNMWESTGLNHVVGPFNLSFVLYFDGDVSISSFVPVSQSFEGNKRIISGTTSNATDEQHILYSYIKCLPVNNGKVDVELIDNPFMDRPAGFGFNGWITKEANTTITTDNVTFVQTLQRTLTSEEITSKQVTINVYVDWKEASIIFVDASTGNNANNGLTTSTPVRSWDGVANKLTQTATNASNRELNIVVLMNGNLELNNIGRAYTITSLYNGIDYRGNARLNTNSSFSANSDLQIDFIKTYSNVRYSAIEGTAAVTGYLSGGSNNLRIGRGTYSTQGTGYTSISQVFGAANGTNKNYRTVIESGYYNNIQLLSSGSSTIYTCATLVLGSDIDRIKANNNDLKVYYRVASTAFAANIYTNDNDKPATNIIVKSGEFGYDGFTYYYNRNDVSYAYAGIYVGGHGANDGSFYGDRILVVEGGNVCNIVGGLKLQSYLSSKTCIYVKNGEVLNIVGGAGVSVTRGDRMIQVTGGTVKYSVSGGSNGFAANDSNTGELVGNSLVYIGGNATIGSGEVTYGNLYGVAPGTVCGAGNGNSSIAVSGKVYTSHVIIDRNATITNSVYGGGNYGYVQKGTLVPTDITSSSNLIIEDCSSSLVSGEDYVIANGTSVTSKAIYYYTDTYTDTIGHDTLQNSEFYKWTIELTGTNTFYIKHENDYLVATYQRGYSSISFTSNVNSATEFTYTTNKRISIAGTNWRGSKVTANLFFSNRNNITFTTSSGTELRFLKITERVDPEDPKPVPREFEVDTIDIFGGTIENSVYGGSNQNRIVGNVDINMTGGNVNETIYGGSNSKGNIEGNVDISIEGGTVGTMQTQDSVFGGGYGSSTNINKNVNIEIKDTKENINILGNIYGGGSLGNILGTTNINIEDHYSDDYSIFIIGNVFGGGRGILGSTSPRSSGNVTVNVDGGTYENLDVYGGYNENGTIQNSAISVNIGENYPTTINDVYGGGNQANVSNSTTNITVKMYENANVNNAYNGGNNAGITGANTREIYAIGATINNLFGGSNNSGALQFTNVYVSDGAKIGNVFGGGNRAEITTYTNVAITDSEVTQNVYGGGNQASVGDNTNVNIYNSIINNVYGGGNAGTIDYTGTGNATNVNIENSSTIKTVYGGGCSAAINGNSSIYIKNSTATNVFGGGEGENAIVNGNTSVNTEGVDEADNIGKVSILENIYGGGDLGKVNGDTVITATKTEVANNIFGGGNKADIEQNTAVNIFNSTAGTVYGGGMNGTVGGSTSVSILENSTITNKVFGGGSKGDVTGNTIVNLDSSKVVNDLFGGGEAARVNGTTVSLTNASEVRNVYGGGDNGITLANTNVALKSVKVLESAFGAGNGEPAIVRGKSYIYADGTTTIGGSLFAGGNNSSTGTTDTNPNKDLANKPLEKATAVADIAGAVIGENVYGGANTSVIYGDTAVNIGNEAIKSYYTSINASLPNYTQGKIDIVGTIYGGGEQMDPNKEYNYDTVSVEGYIQINIDGTGYDTGGDNTIKISGSIFGSGHASRAGLPSSYMGSGDLSDSEQTAGYVTINGNVNIKNYGSIKKPKSMISIQRCGDVVIDSSALWISGATDSTNAHSSTYFSFNHVDALKMKNSSTLYLRATSNLLKSYYSLVDDDKGNEVKETVEIVNEVTGEDGSTYDAVGNYVYGLTGNITHVIKSGQIFTADNNGNAIDLVTDVKSSKTKSVTQNADNRIYMYSGLNLNISADENLGDDTWGPVEGMTFFGIFNTTNTTIDQDENIDISQTTDKNDDFSTIHTGIYDVDYQVSDTEQVKWNDRNYNRSYVEGRHVKTPNEQDIMVDGFYTNYEKFGIPYGDEEEIEESNYAAHNPTSYTDYITPTPDETDYYIWYAGPDQDFYYYDLALIASKLSTYGTVEKTLQGISCANATFRITSVDSSLINGAVLYNKSKILNINTDGDPNKEFALAMKTGTTGWSMNGETNFVTSPSVAYSGTDTYKTENSSATPSLGFYLYHSNNISEEAELGYFTINMILYYWKTPTQQSKARVTIDVAITTKVYDDLGYDASIAPGRQYEIFPRITTNITTKSSFSAYFQLHEKDFATNEQIEEFFSYTDDDGNQVVDRDAINQFMETNYRMIKTDYVFPEDTTITMIDKSKDNPTYYYYTVTSADVSNKKKSFKLHEFRKMGSVTENQTQDKAEYYQDTNRDFYIITVDEDNKQVTYQSECFIFIVDFESAKFGNLTNVYEIVKNQAFSLVLTSDSVRNNDGESLEISILEEYKETNAISFGIYNIDPKIEIDATISPNRIYLGDSTDISIKTNYTVKNEASSDITKIYDTRYFDSKLGVKITIYDEDGNVVHGASLLGAYFKVTEADGSTALYYPRTDGTTRMKIADKVSNSKATITFETSKSTMATGQYKFLIESFGSADGVYFGVESSDSTELNLYIVNDDFGLESEIPENYVIIDKENGYTIEETTGFSIEKEYEILDEDGNVIGGTTDELNDGKNDFEYSVKYTSGYENPYIAVALYRRNYDSVYDRTYSLVDLADYLNISDNALKPVPDDIKDQFAITTYDEDGNENPDKKYVGYEAYGIDFINKAVQDAIDASTDTTTRPIIKLTTKCYLKNKLVSGTYKLVFTLYDRNEVERLVETENEDGTINSEMKTVIEYQRIGDTFSYMIIK